MEHMKKACACNDQTGELLATPHKNRQPGDTNREAKHLSEYPLRNTIQ
jgi:hypothetical protein